MLDEIKVAYKINIIINWNIYQPVHFIFFNSKKWSLYTANLPNYMLGNIFCLDYDQWLFFLATFLCRTEIIERMLGCMLGVSAALWLPRPGFESWDLRMVTFRQQKHLGWRKTLVSNTFCLMLHVAVNLFYINASPKYFEHLQPLTKCCWGHFHVFKINSNITTSSHITDPG